MKKWFIGMLVVCAALFLVVGPAATQPPPPAGPFNILQKYGAIYNSASGWTTTTPPYYPGNSWAVDFTYTCEGVSILHQDGAIWNATTGWSTACPPYYPGSGYARAIEYVRDVTGCWNMRGAGWEFWETGPGTIGGGHEYVDGTQYVVITAQIGTRVYGDWCEWEDTEWVCDPIEGTIVGDRFSIVNHNSDAGGEWLSTTTGVVFWDTENERWVMKGSWTGTDFLYAGGEAGFFASFEAWQGSPCPPPDPD